MQKIFLCAYYCNSDILISLYFFGDNISAQSELDTGKLKVCGAYLGAPSSS